VVVVVGSGEVDSDSMHAADVSSEEATGVVGSFVLAAGTYEVAVSRCGVVGESVQRVLAAVGPRSLQVMRCGSS
jgi:hypothetical protein